MQQLIPPRTGAPDLLDLYGDEAPDDYVRAGFVTSVDGTTVVDGGSRALSGSADRKVFRTLRAVCDVILVGAGTTKAEDYGRIWLADDGAAWRQARDLPPLPRVAVVSRSLDIDERVLAGPTPLVVTCAAAEPARLAGRAEVVIAGEDEVDLAAALDALAARGLRRVLCEGGPRLLTSIVSAGRLDELCLTTSPMLAGQAGVLIRAAMDNPLRLELLHLLEQEGALLARYAVAPS